MCRAIFAAVQHHLPLVLVTMTLMIHPITANSVHNTIKINTKITHNSEFDNEGKFTGSENLISKNAIVKVANSQVDPNSNEDNQHTLGTMSKQNEMNMLEGNNQILGIVDDDGMLGEMETRSVLNLAYMINCGSSCGAMSYFKYGCFCGAGGAGVPVDEIDKCCKAHDKCYKSLSCPLQLFQWYTNPYRWDCVNGTPICSENHGKWGGVSSCSHHLCTCDSQFTACIRKYPCPSTRPTCQTSWLATLFSLLD